MATTEPHNTTPTPTSNRKLHLALLAAALLTLFTLAAVLWLRSSPSACEQVRAAAGAQVGRYEETLGYPTLNLDVRSRLERELAVIQEGPCWHR